MHDINTINRVNYEAFQRAIQNFQAQGRFVLATYEGLTLTTIESFSSANELVDAHAAALKANPATTGTNFKCFQPIPAWHLGARDQSEDRVPPEHTLGQYLSRRPA
jgi:hypothetical protein